MTCRTGTVKLVTVGVLAAAGALDVVHAAAASCGLGYSYAGIQDTRIAHGVRATLVVVERPAIEDGHVAAWVGVGGPGQGPGGKDEWLQVGVSTFTDGITRLYYEVDRPGAGPRFTELDANVVAGTRMRIALLELPGRPGSWQVWVDGAPVAGPIALPGSSGRWQPIATAETWDGGTGACNRFAYRFERPEVLPTFGGAWAQIEVGNTFQNRGYRLLAAGDGAYLAQAGTVQ
jgi:hypothetical protein